MKKLVFALVVVFSLTLLFSCEDQAEKYEDELLDIQQIGKDELDELDGEDKDEDIDFELDTMG